MKNIIIFIVCMLFVRPCLAQDAIKVHVSYNCNNQYLIFEIENTSNDTSFLIYSQNSHLTELDGSCVFISENKREDYGINDMYKEQFPLIEYNNIMNVSKKICPRFVDLLPLKKEYYGISLKDKEQFRGLNRLYVKVKLIVVSSMDMAGRKTGHHKKIYEQYIEKQN